VSRRLVGLILLAAGVVRADQAVYLMRGPALPRAHSVNGYAVELRDQTDGSVEVLVETSLHPIGARGTYSEIRGSQPSVPAGFELPAELRADLRPEMAAWEAATTVLGWVSLRLELVEDDRRPQDAVSVIDRRGGRCSGLANATAALLLAAGFEARTVSGLLIDDRRAIPHRWVECRLPGAGWVPTDPTLGLWAITPRHVAFDDAVLEVPSIEIRKPSDDELLRMPRTGATLVRPNVGAELVCRISDPRPGSKAVAILLRGTDRRLAVLGPEARFESLLPGRWLLEVEVDGRIVERRELTLKAGSVNSYVVQLPEVEHEEVGS
jgi:hypothetical protein